MASQVYSTKYTLKKKKKKKGLIPILLKLFQKIEEVGTRHSMKKLITLIAKPNTLPKKLQARIFGEYRCKHSQQTNRNPNPAINKI